jgi:hypothetical protein
VDATVREVLPPAVAVVVYPSTKFTTPLFQFASLSIRVLTVPVVLTPVPVETQLMTGVTSVLLLRVVVTASK